MNILTYGQSVEALLYNNKGQLRADTTLTIDKIVLNKWILVEKLMIEMLLNNVSYSQMALDFDLEGTSVISFDIDISGNLIDYKVIKQVGGGLEEIIISQLKTFEFLTSLSSIGRPYFRYYLAFDFKIVDTEKYLKEHNKIPIFKVKYDPILGY